MERLGDRMGEYHSTWLAISISCCFPRSQERPHSYGEEEEGEEGEDGRRTSMEQETTGIPTGTMTTRRQSPIPVSKYNTSSICYQQPLRRSQLSCPVIETEDPRIQPQRPSSSRQRQPGFIEGRGTLVSRASKRTRSTTRKWTTRRPTIGNPTDFRRSGASFDFALNNEEPLRAISPIQRRLSPFRPIQLSIYVPGNELPSLPRFSDDEDDDDIPEVPSIERPAQALMKTMSEPVLDGLTRQLSSFSIPRKPLGDSRASSMEVAQAPRTSIDSGLTLNNNEVSASIHKRSTSIDRLRSSDHRPSLAASKSTQDFLEIINAPLPPLPQSTATSHMQASDYVPRSAYSIYRSASKQNLRLQAHLEQRQASIQACDTISEKEERSPVSLLTPPQAQAQLSVFAPFKCASSTTPRSSQILVRQSLQQRADAKITPSQQRLSNPPDIADHPAWIDSDYELPLPSLHKAHSSSSSTLFNEKVAEAGTSNDVEITRPTVTTTISVRPTTPTLSSRLSAWLARSITSLQNNSTHEMVPKDDVIQANDEPIETTIGNRNSDWSSVSYPAPLTIGPGALSLPGEIKKSNSAPGSESQTMKRNPTVKIGHARKQSSVSTFASTIGGGGNESEIFDLEKFPVPVVVSERRISAVGLAF